MLRFIPSAQLKISKSKHPHLFQLLPSLPPTVFQSKPLHCPSTQKCSQKWEAWTISLHQFCHQKKIPASQADIMMPRRRAKGEQTHRHIAAGIRIVRNGLTFAPLVDLPIPPTGLPEWDFSLQNVFLIVFRILHLKHMFRCLVKHPVLP